MKEIKVEKLYAYVIKTYELEDIKRDLRQLLHKIEKENS